MSDRQIQVWLFRLAYSVTFFLLIAPLLVIAIFSISKSGIGQFPPQQFSFEWYVEFLSSPEWKQGVGNSLITATGTMLLSTILGVLAAVGYAKTNAWWKNYIVPVALAPLLIPAAIIGITLLMFFGEYGLQQTYTGIILAHSLWSMPLVFFIMMSTFSRFDWELEEAAYDLGAGPIRTYAEIVLPNIKNGLMAAGLIAFIISLQEFVMALFLSGPNTSTVPVMTWVSLRRSLDPIINVVATILVLAAMIILTIIGLGMGLDRLAKEL